MPRLLTGLILICCINVQLGYSDTLLGIYAGGGQIAYDMSGDFQDLDDQGTSIDLEDDLGLEGESGNYFYVALEHFVPLVPNVKLALSEIEESSRSELTQTIRFDGVTFPENTQIRTTLDFSHTDLSLYYEILDNWVSLDLGLTLRSVDGELRFVGEGLVTAEEDLSFIAPMLYGKAQFELPLTGLYLAAEGNWVTISGAQMTDLWGKLGYVFNFGLGIELGVRALAFTLDDVDDLDANVDLVGTYAALSFHF